MSNDEPFEGRSVYGTLQPKGWVDSKEVSDGVNVSVRGIDVTLSPEAAIRLGRQLQQLGRRMIQRRSAA